MIETKMPTGKQQPCEDCISRREAISAIIDEYYPDAIAIDIVDTIANLPSVTPKAEQKAVLDKIKAEIADLDDADYDYEGYYKAVTDAVKIIDKYKAESEEQNERGKRKGLL